MRPRRREGGGLLISYIGVIYCIKGVILPLIGIAIKWIILLIHQIMNHIGYRKLSCGFIWGIDWGQY